MKTYIIDEHVVDNTGSSLVSDTIQNIIDKASENDTIIINKGKYLVSSLFLKSNLTFIINKDATLIATTDESKYIDIFTRVAGIEMDWYPALLNAINCHNLTIKGEGSLFGNGPYWWNKYWGEDGVSGMRKQYDANKMRFACDYDCKRVRLLLISNCSNVTISGLSFLQSGFWNLHILYSKHIKVESIKIHSNNKNAPSTDGIDIDSSSFVKISNSEISCNDDNIAIKSGRGVDGLKVNIPSHHISIINCKILYGFGITMGSELTGGIHHIVIKNNTFINTSCGFRIKSSKNRKGYVNHIQCSNIIMNNVKYAFQINVNWNSNYNDCVLPESYKGPIYDHYKKLISTIDDNIKDTDIKNIKFKNIKSTYDTTYNEINRIFDINGFENNKINNISFKNCDLSAIEYGKLENINKLKICKCKLNYKINRNVLNDEFDNR